MHKIKNAEKNAVILQRAHCEPENDCFHDNRSSCIKRKIESMDYTRTTSELGI